MSNIPSALKKIQIEGARYGSAASESLIQTLGAVINKMIDVLQNPVPAGVMQPPSVVTLTASGSAQSYVIPANNYALITIVPASAIGVAINGGYAPAWAGSYAATVTAGDPLVRLWARPGETLHYTGGGPLDHIYIDLFPIGSVPTFVLS